MVYVDLDFGYFVREVWQEEPQLDWSKSKACATCYLLKQIDL